MLGVARRSGGTNSAQHSGVTCLARSLTNRAKARRPCTLCWGLIFYARIFYGRLLASLSIPLLCSLSPFVAASSFAPTSLFVLVFPFFRTHHRPFHPFVPLAVVSRAPVDPARQDIRDAAAKSASLIQSHRFPARLRSSQLFDALDVAA